MRHTRAMVAALRMPTTWLQQPMICFNAAMWDGRLFLPGPTIYQPSASGPVANDISLGRVSRSMCLFPLRLDDFCCNPQPLLVAPIPKWFEQTACPESCCGCRALDPSCSVAFVIRLLLFEVSRLNQPPKGAGMLFGVH